MSTPLCQALGLTAPQTLAVAGSGGKTTLIYALARELAAFGQTVIISTTTHIFPPAGGQADELWLWGGGIPSPGELASRLAPGKRLAVAGARTAVGKLGGLNDAQVDALARAGDAWLLVEADGSARRPLKAWAEWEPALPRAAQSLVLVAGLSGLGRPLSAEWVHRPEIFAREADLAPGQAITPQTLAKALLGANGPLRAWPKHKPASLVLNQADAAAPALLDECRRVFRRPSGRAFDRVLAGQLRQGRLRTL